MKKYLNGMKKKLRQMMDEVTVQRHFKHWDKKDRKFVKQYHCPELTKEEKQAIDRYWAQFGIRFKDYSAHRMYYSVTGIHDPRFIPCALFSEAIISYMNDQSLVAAYSDKNMFSFYLPDMNFPTRIGSRRRNRYYDADGKCYGDQVTDEYVDQLYRRIRQEEDHAIIVKVAIGSYAGKGVRKIAIDSRETLKAALTDFDVPNLIMQTVVHQHPFFRQLNESSVNIIRCTTWRKGEEVHLFSPCIRYGISGSHTDVAFRNGVEIINCLGIRPDGRIFDYSIGLEGKKKPVDVEDRYVPQWEQIVQKVCDEHRKMCYFDVVAWDITVNDRNEIVCIEYNIKRPGNTVYQYAHGPIAGDVTDQFLECLKDASVHRQLVPRSHRLPGFQAK